MVTRYTSKLQRNISFVPLERTPMAIIGSWYLHHLQVRYISSKYQRNVTRLKFNRWNIHFYLIVPISEASKVKMISGFSLTEGWLDFNWFHGA